MQQSDELSQRQAKQGASQRDLNTQSKKGSPKNSGHGKSSGGRPQSGDLVDGQQLAEEKRHQRASICDLDLEGCLDPDGDRDRASVHPNDRETRGCVG
jgi:hypothetical protein